MRHSSNAKTNKCKSHANAKGSKCKSQQMCKLEYAGIRMLQLQRPRIQVSRNSGFLLPRGEGLLSTIGSKSCSTVLPMPGIASISWGLLATLENGVTLEFALNRHRLWHKVWWTVHPEPPAPTRGSHLRVSVVPSLQFFQYALEFVPSLRILGFLLLPLNFFVRESHV